jgi:hypothetical protein
VERRDLLCGRRGASQEDTASVRPPRAHPQTRQGRGRRVRAGARLANAQARSPTIRDVTAGAIPPRGGYLGRIPEHRDSLGVRHWRVEKCGDHRTQPITALHERRVSGAGKDGEL